MHCRNIYRQASAQYFLRVFNWQYWMVTLRKASSEQTSEGREGLLASLVFNFKDHLQSKQVTLLMWSNTLSSLKYCKYRYFAGIVTNKKIARRGMKKH